MPLVTTAIPYNWSTLMPTISYTIQSTISPTFDEPPVEDWCFDLILFYRSIAEEDVQARNVLKQLETYSKFSFVVNGFVTCLLASFGLLGNALFVSQLYKSPYFSRRLASHLAMLCVWDMALLLCCLLTYGIMASYYGILPFVGIVAYLLYFFQPFASFCVTGTIWQVLAITVERYTAVSRPLEQRTRNAQFSLRTICFAIAVGAFLLNMVVVPFERRLTDCYEFTQNGYRIRTMIVQQDLVNTQYYAILVHLVPDIIFRAPTPIIVIAILTVRTLQICTRRTVGTQTIQQARRNVPFMLTLLNVKFIMCNTLYMFNTILMEVMGYGGKTSNQQTELEMEEYVKSLYLTDFSNMLLAVHSATNWLIFYHWPRFVSQPRKKKLSSLTLMSNAYGSKASSVSTRCAMAATVVAVSSTIRGCAPLNTGTIEALAQRFSQQKYRIAAKILTTLCLNSQQISRLLLDENRTDFKLKLSYLNGGAVLKDSNKDDVKQDRFSQSYPHQRELLRLLNSSPPTVSLRNTIDCKYDDCKYDASEKDAVIQRHAKELGDLIEKVLNGLANKSSVFEWRDLCRQIGYTHYRVNFYVSAGEWKLVRNILVDAMDTSESYTVTSGSTTSSTRHKQHNSNALKIFVCSPCYNGKKLKRAVSSDTLIEGSTQINRRKISTELMYQDDIPTNESDRNRVTHDYRMNSLQRVMLKAFNFALREMKSGALCAIVDASRGNHQAHQHSLNIDQSVTFIPSSIESLESRAQSAHNSGLHIGSKKTTRSSNARITGGHILGFVSSLR